MPQILCWSAVFFILGFGAGRLRFYVLLNKAFKKRQHMRENRIHDANKENMLTIWSAMYTQSIESVRDLQKGYITSSTAGLIVAATILAREGGKPFSLYFSALFFLLSLVIAFTPLSKTAVKISKDLNLHLGKWHLKSNKNQSVILPEPLTNHRHSWLLICTLALFGLAVVLLGYSIILIPSCTSTSALIKVGPLWLTCY